MATKTPRAKTLFAVTIDAGCNVAMAFVYVVRAGKAVCVQCTQRCGSTEPPYDRAAAAVVENYLEGKAPCTPTVHRIDLGRVPGANEREIASAKILAGVAEGRW